MAKASLVRMSQPSEVSSGHSSTQAAATPNCPQSSAWLAYEAHEVASHVEGRNKAVTCHNQPAADA
jgi:hypothetical protein